jgi:hypothetical protein
MNELKTIKVKAVSYDKDNNIDGGVNIYWTEGAHVVLYQTWEYRCSGNVYSVISPDPIGEDGLLDYFLENWTKGEIEYHLDPENPVNENYC